MVNSPQKNREGRAVEESLCDIFHHRIALRFLKNGASFEFQPRGASVVRYARAVSRQIRLLENLWGVKLFERDHRGIRLTQAGVSLMPSVKEAFDVIERGTRHLTGTVERKRLIVSLPPTFATQWFSSRLGALSEQLPDVDLSIRTQESDECHLQRALWARRGSAWVVGIR